jgi:hypothetical protein
MEGSAAEDAPFGTDFSITGAVMSSRRHPICMEFVHSSRFVRTFFTLALCATTIAAVRCANARLQNPAAGAPGGGPDIHAYVTDNLKTLAVTFSLGSYDPKAGSKISKDFGVGYRMSGNGAVHYSEPSHIQLDGRYRGIHTTIVCDGFKQHVRLGPITQNHSTLHAPGKLTTLLDIGILNDFYLSYTIAEHQGTENVDGVTCEEFKIQYRPGMNDTSYRLIWIDPKTRIVLKRQEYAQITGPLHGALRATYFYEHPVEATPGVFVPTDIAVINADGESVGKTFIQNIQVNTITAHHK